MELQGSNQDQTDESFAPGPGFHELLIELYETQTTVNMSRSNQRLVIHPNPGSSELHIKLQDNWRALSAFLPGLCDACDVYSFMRVELYFAPHAHLCRKCLKQATKYFDIHGWPKTNVEETVS